MDLIVLDKLFTILHLLIIAFNLFGWISKTTRKMHFYFAMLTLGCWTVLGIWLGLGYCPITDWQWNIKAQLGEQNLPSSFIKYFGDKLTGLNINSGLIDFLTLVFFLVAIICSIKVNFFNHRKNGHAYKKLLIGVTSSLFILVCYYFFQPIKKGKGADNTTQYHLVANWPQLPKNFILGNPTGLAIDSQQNLIVFTRADRVWPLIGSMPKDKIKKKTIHIIDGKSGRILKSWGENMFVMPHGLTLDSKGNLWVTDVGSHQIFKFNANGEILLKLGVPCVSGKDRVHFNKPTDVAVAKDGSFYVSDGYGNSRVVKFSADGNYLLDWGKKGDQLGEFDIPHAITLDSLENVYVADRENRRIQVFNKHGKFLTAILDNSFGAICSVTFNTTKNKLFAIDDFSFLKMMHKGADVMLFDYQGKVQTRFGRSSATSIEANWYHDIAVDKDENIYVGDILNNQLRKFKMVKPQ